jgi:pimeloyl-ACP methyl ester carboxylesterase
MRPFSPSGLLFILLLAVPAWGQPSDAQAWWGRYHAGVRAVALPDGRHLNLFCEGKGGPVVVLEGGLGPGAWDWRKVQGAIAPDTQVCSYDRAGYFGSDPAEDARDAGAEADDLAALLKAAHVPAPYVLVGHSYGGLIVRMFAFRHPREVAGLVLLEPSAEYQTQRVMAVAPDVVPILSDDEARLAACAAHPRPAALEGKCLLRPPPRDLPPQEAAKFAGLEDPAYAETMLRETRSLSTVTSDEVKAEKKPLGAIPVLLLEQGNGFANLPGIPPAESEALWVIWHQMHVEMQEISRASELLIVPHTGHEIQVERPDAVIAGVAAVLRKARAATSR